MLKPNELLVPDRWLLVVEGLVQVIVEDQEGRRIGPSKDPKYSTLVENQIPGASYSPGRVFSSVFLNQPGIYTFTLIGQAPNDMRVSFSLYNAVTKLDTFFFQGVHITECSQARLVYDTADHWATPVLALDREGNSVIEEIQPTILSPQASDDVIPPTTQIDIKDNFVTITATDNPDGAGVLRTYYTTDGLNHSMYTEPFPIPPDAKIVMAYSEDRAGNLEYPGAVCPVLGISKTEIVLEAKSGYRKAVQQVIEVVNLDPMALTGPLEWEASTEAPWLTIQPNGGLTPHSITLSAHSARLKAGHHESTVVVRALSPGTVFAECHLRIHVKVTAASKSQRK